MKIEGSYLLPGGRERIFELLVDEATLRRCVPGCQTLVRQGEDRYAATLEMGIGAVKGRFDGTVVFTEKLAPASLAMVLSAQGKTGFVKGKGRLRLEPDSQAETASTRVSYDGEVQVGGTLASVGQRMVQTAARVMAGQFFAAIEAEAKAKAAQGAPPPPQTPLRNLFRWLMTIVRGWFRRRAQTTRTPDIKA